VIAAECGAIPISPLEEEGVEGVTEEMEIVLGEDGGD
jgi:hypothetical protein